MTAYEYYSQLLSCEKGNELPIANSEERYAEAMKYFDKLFKKKKATKAKGNQ